MDKKPGGTNYGEKDVQPFNEGLEDMNGKACGHVDQRGSLFSLRVQTTGSLARTF
jgi:hypothetical protein